MSDQPARTPLSILVVDDELNIRKTLAMSLESDGHTVVAVSNFKDAIDEASRHAFDLAFVDLRLGAKLGSDLIPELTAQSPWTRVVIITAHGSIDNAVETMKRGAADYLTKPFTPAQIRLVTERVMQVRALEQKLARIEALAPNSNAETEFQSDSVAMQRVLKLARQLANNNATVLLRGESGTGKGVLARAIHGWSGRHDMPFATVSCPSLSGQLLESELFGHARGAFTGAVTENRGRIASCAGGTLFLDEIGDLPLELQPKLLRFLQDREYERVGDPVTRHADVRVVAATNVDLEKAVQAGKFRGDLLYRIKVVQIDMPPLRDRSEDIIRLAEQFLVEFRLGRRILGFTAQAQAALKSYPWPGNIRELRNVIERAVILCQGEEIGLEHLPAGFTQQQAAMEVGDPVSLDQLEETHIRRVLARSKSLDDAAAILGIDVATLWRRRKKYGI